MEYRTLQCREHGGNFKVPAKRGRPPTRCGGNYPKCDMARKRQTDSVAARTARTLKGELPKRSNISGRTRAVDRKAADALTVTPDKLRRAAMVKQHEADWKANPRKRTTQQAIEASKAIVRHNPSVPLAKKAKDQLEPLGWVCTATKDDDTARVAFSATRGEEYMTILFEDGKTVSQDYWLWDANKTSGQNGKPKSRLPFNPDEMTDAELATALRGKQVEWWNRIKSGKEKATISMKQIKIEHTFYDPSPTDDDGNEIEPSEPLRIVSFVDPTGGGFRSFHVDALMRVSM
jgi:hypothetical protein